MATLQAIVDEVNRRAVGREFGDLQVWRKAARGGQRLASRKVFDNPHPPPDEFALHRGGRRELQFNIGAERAIEGYDLRYGVAFSFELSQALPDIEPLRPKVPFFNEYILAHPESFDGLRMWYYKPDKSWVVLGRPAPIEAELVDPEYFIFLGASGHSAAPEYDAILDTLERLLPLYRFVESNDGRRGAAAGGWREPPLRLRPRSPVRWTEATLVERTINVELRHRALQDRLCRELVEEYGEGCVGDEYSTPDGGRIDVVVRRGDERILFEIKTAPTARGCIREAVGQVLDHARWRDRWPDGGRVDRVVVVGSKCTTAAEDAYLERLNRSFPVRIEYRRVVLEGE